ncbi:hypothetical protein AB0M32_29550 [Streptomyces sp. NPDC051985]|uniref:hypothetical protein n=1 Tax=Streptomyces sp. NPDC051985 TaxID=3155807 RepID=UPI0034126559
MPHDGSAGAGLPQPGTAEAGAADSGADPVLLVVSELGTDALVHTQDPVRLELLLRGRPAASRCAARRQCLIVNRFPWARDRAPRTGADHDVS